MLAAYEAPAMDPAIDEELRAYIDSVEELPDTDYWSIIKIWDQIIYDL